MVEHNAPLTPPLTENDTQRLLASQGTSLTNAPTSLGPGHASTVYQDIFPAISNLAIQNLLSDLVNLAGSTELSADSSGCVDESRLLLIGPLVLSYIILDELPPARFALSRLPENLASHPFTRSLLKLLAAMQNRAYPLIYKTADELLSLVQGDFFDNSLAAVVKLLVERHIYTFRRKTAELLLKAYTSLPISLAGTYVNLPDDEACRVMESYGWTLAPATNLLIPPSASKLSSQRSFASSLSTVRLMVGGAAQFEAGG